MTSGARILVVGAGSIGQRHHENLIMLGARAELTGWRGFSVEAFETQLRDGADGVVIATATDVRLPLIAACADAGIPVYVEKPLAFEPAEIQAISAVSAPIATRSVLGLMMRYHPAFRVLASSDLSDIFQFSMSIGHDVTQWRKNWRYSESYAARAMGGGVLLDLCHEIDMAACLFPGLALTSVESLGHAGFPGVDMASRISLSGPGVSGEVAMDYLTPRLHRRTTLRGCARMFDFDFAAQRYRVADPGEQRLIDLPFQRNDMFLAAMRDFLSLIAGKRTSAVEHLPRLDLCLPSARLVALAWAARQFSGQITKEIA